MLLLLTLMVFFQEIHVFQLRWIGLFEANKASLHLETCQLQEVFHLKSNSILTEKQWAGCCSFKNTWFSSEMYMCFFYLALLAYWQKMSISTHRKLWFAGSIPSKTYSFLPGKQCTRYCSFYHRCFLWRDTCVSSNPMNSPICSKKCLSPPGNTKVGGSIPFKS
jgi:hypothetical protein